MRRTAALTALLVLVPGLLLWRWPRPRALGLARLLPQTALLQSFPASPQRAIPALWSQRLGSPLAGRIWRQQRRIWWQFWGRDGDGGPYLAFAAPSAQPLPPLGLRVDDLVVVAPDPLSQRLLQDQLKLSGRQPRGLEQRCLQRLQQEQAVFWSPLGLGLLAGPMAPLLQRFQEGCLSLSLQGSNLAMEGEASSTSGILARPGRLAPLPGLEPLPADLLLEWRGPALEGVLQGLLSRQLIREPLAARYGIGEGQLALLGSAPFALRLRPVSKGPFQASLELELQVGADRKPWTQLLTTLVPAIQTQGLEAASSGSPTLPATSWRRQDGQVVGGWRWLLHSSGPPRLLLFLGPQPPLLAQTLPKVSQSGPALTSPTLTSPEMAAAMVLRARPQALARLGLLPTELPLPLQQSGQLDLVAFQPAGRGRALASPLSQLTGRLQLQQARRPVR